MTAGGQKVVLFGNGQVASVAYTYLTHQSPHEVVAFTVDGEHVADRELYGLPIVPFEEVDRLYPPDTVAMHISISYRRINRLRAEKYDAAKARGYQLLSYVSPTAVTTPDLELGDNCWIGCNTVVQPFVTIGDNVYVGGGSHVGHHSVIGPHCFLASSAALAGFVTVEPYCFIGINATIRDGITIAASTVVGAGAIILQNTRECGVYASRHAPVLPMPSGDLPEDLRAT
jgi:sugar O-acyltransferase (sialic acid O-acetyltransferase NeuD family)